MKVAFSHRPKDGISVGVTQAHDKLFVAVALANTGLSLAGNFNRKRRDAFSRKKARQILQGRLQAAIKIYEAEPYDISYPKYVSVYHTSISEREFIQQFRKLFKPDVLENDNQFGSFANETLETIRAMVSQTIVNLEVPF